MRGVVVAGSNWWMPPSEVAILGLAVALAAAGGTAFGLRQPAWALAAGQALLGSDRFLDRHRPEVVLQIGATPTTRATQAARRSRRAARRRRPVPPRPRPGATVRRGAWRPIRIVSRRQLIHRDRAGARRTGRPSGPTSTNAHAGRWTSVLDATDDRRSCDSRATWPRPCPTGGTLFVGNSTADPRPRYRDVAARRDPGAREPRRQRHRRPGLDRARRGERRHRPHVRADRRPARSSTTRARCSGTARGSRPISSSSWRTTEAAPSSARSTSGRCRSATGCS